MSRFLIRLCLFSLSAGFLFVCINAHASGFDRGVGGSSSALSQFNKISGGNISRPPIMKNHVPSSAIPDASAINALATGMMLFQMIEAMSNGQQQQADLARAQAEAERQRQLEEKRLRVQRAVWANKLREIWDKDEKVIADSLDGSFDLPGDNQVYRDFFGIRTTTPSEFNAIESSDLSVTEPFGSGATASLLTTEKSAAEAGRWYRKRTQCYTSDIQKAILQDGSVSVRDAILDIVKEVLIPNKYRNAENAIDHGKNVDELIVNLLKAMGPERLVKVLVNGSAAEHQEIADDLNMVANKFYAAAKKTGGISSGRLSLLQDFIDVFKSTTTKKTYYDMRTGVQYP